MSGNSIQLNQLFLAMNISKADLQKEVVFKASRSGGKGGQNVNKVSTKVELLFDIGQSQLFTEEEKQLLIPKLTARLNRDGYLQVMSEEERSQFMNKEKALEKLHVILAKALYQPKKRKATKPGKAAKAARLADKKKQSARKDSRRRNFDDQ
jgi:ribosome-associated protein